MTEPTKEQVERAENLAHGPYCHEGCLADAIMNKAEVARALAAERDAGWNEAISKAGSAVIEKRNEGFGNMLDALGSLKRPVTPERSE